MIALARKHRKVCSVVAFVIHGPNPQREGEKDENHWMVGVDVGGIKGQQGFESRNELARQLMALLAGMKLSEAGFVEKKFVRHHHGVEHIYIALADHKKDGTVVDPEELKRLMMQAVEEVNNAQEIGSQVIIYREKSWGDLTPAIDKPDTKGSWSVE